MKRYIKCHACGGTGLELNHAVVGSEFRKWRLKSGIELKAVARRTGFSAAYVSDLERGKRNWNSTLVEKFQKALSEKCP